MILKEQHFTFKMMPSFPQPPAGVLYVKTGEISESIYCDLECLGKSSMNSKLKRLSLWFSLQIGDGQLKCLTLQDDNHRLCLQLSHCSLAPTCKLSKAGSSVPSFILEDRVRWLAESHMANKWQNQHSLLDFEVSSIPNCSYFFSFFSFSPFLPFFFFPLFLLENE